MKAVFVASPEGVIVKDVSAPYPKDDEIVVRMKVCGLCGSDLEKTTIIMFHVIHAITALITPKRCVIRIN